MSFPSSMSLLKIQPSSFHISQITLLHPTLSSPHSIPLHISVIPRKPQSSNAVSATSFYPIRLSKRQYANPRVSESKAPVWIADEESIHLSSEFEDIATDGAVYKETLRLVECSMFAAVSGLAYFLSNSLAIENYFGCFFSLPIVVSSLRWGVAAGRKTMVATTMLLLVLSGPVKASTYLVSMLGTSSDLLDIIFFFGMVTFFPAYAWISWCNHGFFVEVGGKLGSFDLLVHIRSVRAIGAMGYVLISSFLIRENILAVITINIHASLTYLLTAIGVNTIPSMDAIYAIFGTVVSSTILYCFLLTAFAELWFLCILAAHIICCVSGQTWAEGFFDTAKMAREGNLRLV
ncbi:hypothetical protein HHK36_007022 [Tetracentron sinense]|uniref:Uncharacterized protein n=1 Tax=Tetracentron sinense TaxID=13715 RepID=A0A835DPL1_TETSI|nr:hypothetical protein HHK36_007022 [Tetracentron sinense]